MLSLPALRLLLFASVATRVCATCDDVIVATTSDSPSGSSPNPACVSADLVESGSFGLAFFGGEQVGYHKSLIVKTLNQTPDQEIPYDAVTVLNNIQHANGNSIFLINLPDFGSMLQEDLRAQVVQFHEQYPQLTQDIPMARIYFFIGSSDVKLGNFSGGLQFLRDLYGMDIASRIQLVFVTPSPNERPWNFDQDFNKIFPYYWMLPVLRVNPDMTLSNLISDIHTVVRQDAPFFLHPQPIQLPSDVDFTADEDPDTVEMSIDQVRGFQQFSGYARERLSDFDGLSGDMMIPVHRCLKLLHDICGSCESSARFEGHVVRRAMRADSTVRAEIFRALCLVDVDAVAVASIFSQCRRALSQDVIAWSKVSAAAVQQYLRFALPHQERIQVDLLKYILLNNEQQQREQCSRHVRENLYLACPNSHFVNLVSYCDQYSDWVPCASKLQIIFRQFSIHRPERVSAEFVDVLLAIAWYYTLQCKHDFFGNAIYMAPMSSPKHVRALLQLIVQFSSTMPDYLNKVSGKLFYWPPTTPWHRLMLILDHCARRPQLLSPEFVTVLYADLIRIAEQTVVENQRWPEETLLCDSRGEGFVFLLRHWIGNPPEAIGTAMLQNLIDTILIKAFPRFEHRLRAFHSAQQYPVDVLYWDLGPEQAVEFFRTVCRSSTTRQTEDESVRLHDRLLRSLQYIHDGYRHDTVSQCLTHLCRNIGRDSSSSSHPLEGPISDPDQPTPLSQTYVEYFLWLSSNNRIDESSDDLRYLVAHCPEVARLHGPELLHIMRSLNADLAPDTYPDLVRSGAAGINLYRKLEENLSEPTLAAVRRSARATLPPECWVELYSSDIVTEVAALGVGPYFAEIFGDLEPEEPRCYAQRLIVLLLLRSNVLGIPLVYLESVLDHVPPQAVPIQDETVYAALFYRVLDLETETDLLETSLSRYFLDEGRPEFFSLLCTQAIQDVTSQPQRQRRLSFCLQILLQLIERNPIKAANVFARSACDPDSLAPALHQLLECLSQQVAPGPGSISHALGDQIMSLYRSRDQLAEPQQQWLTYMLPIAARFPTEQFTASDLAFQATHGLHPQVVLDHASWLRDTFSHVPEEDFNRVQDGKSILGELLFTLNQWPDALGADDPNSALYVAVQRTSSWSVVMTEQYMAHVQADLSPTVKAALDHAIVATRVETDAEMPEPDRHALAALLYIALRRNTAPNGDVLRSLLVVCSLVRLEGPETRPDTSKLSMEVSYQRQYLEIVLQLYDVSEAFRLRQDDLIAAVSGYLSANPPGSLLIFRGVSLPYRLLSWPLDFASVDVRDLVENVISRSPPSFICGHLQNDCVLDVIQRHANVTEDPSFRQWLQHVEVMCRQKIAVGVRHDCHRRRLQRERDRVAPVTTDVPEIPPNRAEAPDNARNAPNRMPVPTEQPRSQRTFNSAQQTISDRSIGIIIVCAVFGVGASVAFVWWKRRS